MLKFCFPERDPDTIDGDGSDDLDADCKGKKLRGTKKNKETNFYVPIEQKDDVEKMKVRNCCYFPGNFKLSKYNCPSLPLQLAAPSLLPFTL
jgi:hypothetical protein